MTLLISVHFPFFSLDSQVVPLIKSRKQPLCKNLSYLLMR